MITFMVLKNKFGICLAKQCSLCINSNWTIFWYWKFAKIGSFLSIPKNKCDNYSFCYLDLEKIQVVYNLDQGPL